MLLDTAYAHVSCNKLNRFGGLRAMFVVTETPRRHNIELTYRTNEQFDEANDDWEYNDVCHSFDVPLPYLHFVIQTESFTKHNYDTAKDVEDPLPRSSVSHIFAADGPFDPLKHNRFVFTQPPIPNTYTGGNVCADSSIKGGTIYDVLNKFHSSTYNADITYIFEHPEFIDLGFDPQDEDEIGPAIAEALTVLESLSVDDVVARPWTKHSPLPAKYDEHARQRPDCFRDQYFPVRVRRPVCSKDWTPLPVSDIIFDGINFAEEK